MKETDKICFGIQGFPFQKKHDMLPPICQERRKVFSPAGIKSRSFPSPHYHKLGINTNVQSIQFSDSLCISYPCLIPVIPVDQH